MLPADHSIYSQGPSITFHNHSSSPSQPKPKLDSLEDVLKETPWGHHEAIFEVGEFGRLSFLGEEATAAAAPEDSMNWDGEDDSDDDVQDPTPLDGAFLFWRDGDLDPSEFGISIVEGDVPGSDYFAAVLRESVEFANSAAIRLGVPIRFV